MPSPAPASCVTRLANGKRKVQIVDDNALSRNDVVHLAECADAAAHGLLSKAGDIDRVMGATPNGHARGSTLSPTLREQWLFQMQRHREREKTST